MNYANKLDPQTTENVQTLIRNSECPLYAVLDLINFACDNVEDAWNKYQKNPTENNQIQAFSSLGFLELIDGAIDDDLLHFVAHSIFN